MHGSVGGGPAGDEGNRVDGTGRSPRAWALVAVPATLATACLAAALTTLANGDVRHGWSALAALAAGSLVAQLVRPGRPHAASDRTAIAFASAGAILLPPQLLVLLVVTHVVASWLGHRRPWLERLTDLAAAVLASLAAWGGWQLTGDGRPAFGALVACVLAVAALHAFRAPARRWLGGGDARPAAETLVVDLVLVSLGFAAATFWRIDPWLVPIALGPLLLVQRSLAVPQLVAEARIDAKTGLYNARWFARTLDEELGRAARFERPLSLIMADLDLLRDINNAHGHLAGDAVLQGIAGIFRAQLRHYDVPARFGGEEFSIVLPETPPEIALEIAERIRRAVEERAFRVETSPEPIHATISIGVAGFPAHADDANELVHRADVAVYEAKLAGRNRTVLSTATAEGGRARVMHVAFPGEAVAAPARARPRKPEVERRRRARPGPVQTRLIEAARTPGSPVGVTAAGGAIAGAVALIAAAAGVGAALLAGAALYAGVVFAGPLLLLRRAERRARDAERALDALAAPTEPDAQTELEQVS
jgi:diguanylate cyclase (GGDEF)-like protein